jgi:hypothetical protein
MNKDELITIIRNARGAHKKWVENALSLIEGLPLDKSQVPVNSTDCAFGKWYYSDGQAFKSLPSYRDIEDHHDALHKTYRAIFVLLFSEEKNESFFSRLFGKSQKTSAENQRLAREKFKVLEQQSKVIMGKLDELEKIIVGMSPEQIDSYINKKGSA